MWVFVLVPILALLWTREYFLAAAIASLWILGKLNHILSTGDTTKMTDKKRASVKKKKKGEYEKNVLWAMGLSILSVFGLGLLGYIGLYMGINSLKEINRTKKLGENQAKVAIVLGAIFGPIKSVVGLLVQAGH